MNSQRVILNFAKGGWYPRGQERLKHSLQSIHTAIPGWFATSELELDCPTHELSPYAFKPAIFEKVRQQGFRSALWCDAAVWAIKPLEPIFEYIERVGHVLFFNGMVGNWSTDRALESFDIDRDTAMGINEIMGCCMGLDFTSERSLEFLQIWLEKSRDGKTFPGDWNNDFQQCSKDPRCRGHRHDQTAASIIAWRLGMEKIVAHETFFQYYENPQKIAYVYGQQNDMSMIHPSVLLLNQGM
jgi:hypothetical protein